MADSPTPRRFSLPREIRIILSVGLLVFVFAYLVLPQFAGARKSLHLLAALNPFLVVLAVACEVAAIYSYVELTRTVLYPYSPSRFNTLRVNLAGLAISHVVPGGTAPAGALSYRIFNELGVPKETNAFGLATQGSGSAVVLNIIFWSALVISIPLRGFNPAYGFAALAGVFLLGAFFGTILLLTRGQRHADAWLRALARRIPAINPDKVSELLVKVAARITVLINNRRTLWWAFTWAGLNWLFDAACLWVFVWSYGHAISPIDLLVAYGLANVLAVIPITPGGLGVVEASLTGLLVLAQVDSSQAVLATLTYRLASYWAPLCAGPIAYGAFWMRYRRRRSPPESSPA